MTVPLTLHDLRSIICCPDGCCVSAIVPQDTCFCVANTPMVALKTDEVARRLLDAPPTEAMIEAAAAKLDDPYFSSWAEHTNHVRLAITAALAARKKELGL